LKSATPNLKLTTSRELTIACILDPLSPPRIPCGEYRPGLAIACMAAVVMIFDCCAPVRKRRGAIEAITRRGARGPGTKKSATRGASLARRQRDPGEGKHAWIFEPDRASVTAVRKGPKIGKTRLSGGSCWPVVDPGALPTLIGTAAPRPVAAFRGDRSPFTRTSHGQPPASSE